MNNLLIIGGGVSAASYCTQFKALICDETVGAPVHVAAVTDTSVMLNENEL